jgi:hypothetical protein
MKVIIDQNTIDLKLTNDDLLHLRDHGYVRSETDFPSNKLITYVEIRDIKELKADYTDVGIIIYMPAEHLEELKSSFKLGFKSSYQKLNLTLEKVLPKKLKS